MTNEKFIDARLKAREKMFQQLHLSTFDTMCYARNIQELVKQNGHDIQSTNHDYIQLARDYQVTKNLAPLYESQLEPLCENTDQLLKTNDQALANKAQLCAAAISTLNHWRILSEIPEDLRDSDTVTKALKDKFNHHMQTWEYILDDLTKTSQGF